MHRIKKQFLFKLLLFVLILSAIQYVLFKTVLKAYYLDIFPVVFLIFVIVHYIAHHLIVSAADKSPTKFNAYFMLSNTGKLLFYLFFIVIYLFINREQAIPFIAYIIPMYFLFKIFEVFTLNKELKKIKESSEKSSKSASEQ